MDDIYKNISNCFIDVKTDDINQAKHIILKNIHTLRTKFIILNENKYKIRDSIRDNFLNLSQFFKRTDNFRYELIDINKANFDDVQIVVDVGSEILISKIK